MRWISVHVRIACPHCSAAAATATFRRCPSYLQCCHYQLCKYRVGFLFTDSAPDTAGSTLAVINPKDGSVKELRTPYASYGNISVQQVRFDK